jgi:DNA-binding NarL/FixJ family response regulator
LEKARCRVLVVDDHEEWTHFLAATLMQQQELSVISEASDGLEAVQQAQILQPDLILLDIGLPTLNGIEAARRIREVSPASKILFVSENRSQDIAEEALSTGASGYVVKSDVGSELLPAVRAVLEGKRFVSMNLAGLVLSEPTANQRDGAQQRKIRHEVEFYADDAGFVDGFARFIQSALESGNPVIVIVTETHRAHLLRRLEADGVNVPAAIEQGSYIPWDTADALSRLAVNHTPDPIRCAKVIGDLIMEAAKAVKGEHGRVAVCGEIAPTLLSSGNGEGAIKLEHLWDEITKGYGVHTLCGYLSSAFPEKEGNPILERICAEHSAVHGRELCY